MISAIFLVVLLISTYKLTISPPPWYDEGIIIQTAKHMYGTGELLIRVAPDTLIKAGVIASTGFPVVLPESIIFHFFGSGLFQARMLMVLYIFGLVVAVYFFARELYGKKIALYSLLLVGSFAQVYGNGKNVLGEVPGLFFLVLFLFFLTRLERRDFKGWHLYVLAGLTAGLAVATKPIFLILLGAGGIAYFIHIRKIKFEFRSLFLGVLSLLVPLGYWAWNQFGGYANVQAVLNDYANPYALSDVSAMMLTNAKLFFTSTTPIYFALLLVALLVSFGIRRFREGAPLKIAETIILIFSILDVVVFLRTAGWYRYLFIGFVPLLILFPYALENIIYWVGSLLRTPSFSGKLTPTILGLLILFQFYQIGFSSFVSDYYTSTRSASLEQYFSMQDPAKSVFLYDIPEAVIFLKSENYYQYLHVSDSLIVGQDEVEKIYVGIPDSIVLGSRTWDAWKLNLGFDRYSEKERFERYVVLERL